MLGAARLTQVRGAGGPKGQQVFEAAGGTSAYFEFDVPAGVTEISAVAVGMGGHARGFASGESGFTIGGPGGNLRYANAIPVTPLEKLYVYVNTNGSYILRAGGYLLNAWSLGTAGTQPGAGAGAGFNGGSGTTGYWEEPEDYITGGGAGGYTSAGGNSTTSNGRGGGGVSLLGGSVGGAGASSPNFTGEAYGGGAGKSGIGGKGGVRIIWGAGRAYPNTNTGDV